MKKIRAPFLLMFGLLVNLNVAYALDQTDSVGGNGGNYFSSDCGVGAALVGIDARTGWAVDAITALCADVSSSGSWTSGIYQKGGRKGGSGGSSSRLRCPTNYAVEGIRSSNGSGYYSNVVGAVQLYCKRLNSATTITGSASWTSYRGRFSSNPQNLGCNSNHAARGLFGRSGALLDQIGVLCNDSGDIDDPPASGYNGQWSSIQNWPLIAIHSVLTPQGEVLTFGTNDSGVQGAQFFYDVWNPANNSHQTLNNSLQVDSFCSAPLVIPETGKILMPGGDARYGGGYNKGIVDAPLFELPQRCPMARLLCLAALMVQVMLR